MPARTLFAVGAIGGLVKEIQQALIASGCDLQNADRIYGQGTLNAVKRFQTTNSLPANGVVDEATWQILMQRPVPPIGERCLQLTAAFEGHGFELAIGNFDGALLTWGIIGFTLISGEVQSIVQAVNSAHPELVQQTFGDNKDELLRLMSAPLAVQKQWANAHTVRKGSLAEPWRSLFASFGSLPEVQAEQLKHVQKDYLNPAINTANKVGFTSELGLALSFDIHVQNGGLKSAVLKSILESKSGMPEPELRKLVANAAADSAKATWREDVRSRKLTLATGEGVAHGHKYTLENWGLSGDFAAAELGPNEAAAA